MKLGTIDEQLFRAFHDCIDYAEYCIGDSYKYDTSNMKTVKLEQNSVDSIRNKIMFLSLLRGWLYTIYINDVI